MLLVLDLSAMESTRYIAQASFNSAGSLLSACAAGAGPLLCGSRLQPLAHTVSVSEARD